MKLKHCIFEFPLHMSMSIDKLLANEIRKGLCTLRKPL